jgi:hypothetical protein
MRSAEDLRARWLDLIAGVDPDRLFTGEQIVLGEPWRADGANGFSTPSTSRKSTGRPM